RTYQLGLRRQCDIRRYAVAVHSMGVVEIRDNLESEWNALRKEIVSDVLELRRIVSRVDIFQTDQRRMLGNGGRRENSAEDIAKRQVSIALRHVGKRIFPDIREVPGLQRPRECGAVGAYCRRERSNSRGEREVVHDTRA